MALLALVEPLAGIGRHHLALDEAALGTGQGGFELDVVHPEACHACVRGWLSRAAPRRSALDFVTISTHSGCTDSLSGLISLYAD